MIVEDLESEVRIRTGAQSRVFPKHADLATALDWLERLNQTRRADGTPIYACWLSGPHSIWAFHQQSLFWHYLVELRKYQPVLDYLLGSGATVREFRSRSVFLRWMLIRLGALRPDRGRPRTALRLAQASARGMSAGSRLANQLKRERVLIYTPDFVSRAGRDFRFYEIYGWLHQHGVPYREVFHTTFGWKYVRNALRRCAFALYREAFRPLANGPFEHHVLNEEFLLPEVDDALCRYFRIIVADLGSLCLGSLAIIDALEQQLAGSHFRLLISLDDPRYTNELIVTCRRRNIRTIGIQHGQFTKYHVGWHNYRIPPEYSISFDRLYVWNEYWRKVLRSYSTQYQENVEISGSIRPLPRVTVAPRRQVTSMSELNLLVPYEALGPKDGIRRTLAAFRERGARLVFKLRPDHEVAKQLREYGCSERDVTVMTSLGEEDINRIDAVIGLYSTFLHEMLFYRLPVLVVKSCFDYGHQMIDDGLAHAVDPDALDEAAILSYLNGPRLYPVDPWPEESTTLGQTLAREYEMAMAATRN